MMGAFAPGQAAAVATVCRWSFRVVSGGDQAPFRADSGPASSFEAPDPSVRLDLAEDRLHHPQPSCVEPLTALGGEHSSHEVVGSAQSRLAWSAAGRVGGDDRDHAPFSERVDLVIRPVAGVGEHDLGTPRHARPARLSFCRGDDRLELLEVAALSVVSSAATMICCSVTAAWAL